MLGFRVLSIARISRARKTQKYQKFFFRLGTFTRLDSLNDRMEKLQQWQKTRSTQREFPRGIQQISTVIVIVSLSEHLTITKLQRVRYILDHSRRSPSRGRHIRIVSYRHFSFKSILCDFLNTNRAVVRQCQCLAPDLDSILNFCELASALCVLLQRAKKKITETESFYWFFAIPLDCSVTEMGSGSWKCGNWRLETHFRSRRHEAEMFWKESNKYFRLWRTYFIFPHRSTRDQPFWELEREKSFEWKQIFRKLAQQSGRSKCTDGSREMCFDQMWNQSDSKRIETRSDEIFSITFFIVSMENFRRWFSRLKLLTPTIFWYAGVPKTLMRWLQLNLNAITHFE